VEQQLAASSPNAIFQQTILDATQKEESKEEELEQQEGEGEQPKQQCLAEEDAAATMGTMVAEQSTNVGQHQQQMMEFLEAQKAFQKLFSGQSIKLLF
jgi:hypothetical protein